MPVYPYEGISPQIEKDVLIAPGAMVVGRVKIGEGSAIWYNAVLRGDVHDIVIGRYSNIQDGAMRIPDEAAALRAAFPRWWGTM